MLFSLMLFSLIGAAPEMLNVPSTTMVLHSYSVGYPFFFVDYWDNNELDEVTVKLISIDPPTDLFDVHAFSGKTKSSKRISGQRWI